MKWPLGEPQGSGGPQPLTGVVVTAEAAGAVPDGMVAIEVAPDQHPQARTRATPRLLVELESDVVRRDDVVAPHHPLVFHAEDLLEIHAAEGHERRSGMSRRAGEFGIEVGEEMLAEVAVGEGDGGDAGHAELIDEPSLQGAIGPFAAAPRLRG